MKDYILEIRNLTKVFRSNWTFRPIRAVENVNLQLERGEAFGFLGHNGAGKTTTLKCIVGLIKVNTGEILLDGKKLINPSQRSTIGYLPEQPYFYDHLTVRETLEFFTALHDLSKKEQLKRIDETLEIVSLKDRANNPVRALSKGLQQRLGIAQAIVNRPSLLLLDEPFSGLDPVGRREIRDLVIELRRQGTTIFMSSHILSDVQTICDRVVIMAQGSVRTECSLNSLAEIYGESFELTVRGVAPSSELGQALIANSTKMTYDDNRHSLELIVEFADRNSAEQALRSAVEANAQVKSFHSGSKSLEEVFIQITEAARNNKGTTDRGIQKDAQVMTTENNSDTRAI